MTKDWFALFYCFFSVFQGDLCDSAPQEDDGHGNDLNCLNRFSQDKESQDAAENWDGIINYGGIGRAEKKHRFIPPHEGNDGWANGQVYENQRLLSR